MPGELFDMDYTWYQAATADGCDECARLEAALEDAQEAHTRLVDLVRALQAAQANGDVLAWREAWQTLEEMVTR